MALASCRAHLVIVARFLGKCTRSQLEYLEQGFKVLEESIDEVRWNAYCIPQCDDPTVESWMLQFADCLSSQNDQFSLFFCRHEDCLWVTRSCDWPNNSQIGRWHFFCPKCSRRYNKGHHSSNVVKANKIACHLRHPGVILKDDQSIDGEYQSEGYGVVAPDEAIPWTAPSDESITKEWDIQPFIWEDAPLRQVQDRFKVVAHDMLEDLRALPTARERLRCVLNRAEGAMAPGWFRRCFPTPEELARMQAKNRTKDAGGGLDLDKYENEGWLGADLQFMRDALNNPATQDELAAQYLAGRLHLQILLENAKWTAKRR